MAPEPTRFRLPNEVADLASARKALKKRYCEIELAFSFDGNLVGDLGEALAVELFGLKLAGRAVQDIDGTSPCGKTVQVKASGTGRGAAFRRKRDGAEQLLVFDINFDDASATLIYNGPEKIVRDELGNGDGQRMASKATLLDLDATVLAADRLPMTKEPSWL